MLVYFMDIWSILQPFSIFCGNFVYFSFSSMGKIPKKNLATLRATCVRLLWFRKLCKKYKKINIEKNERFVPADLGVSKATGSTSFKS
jgi:hypothetical protein